MSKTNWNASLYNDNHSFVSQYGESLIPLLNPQQNELILDLGCGTGTLSQKIAESGAKVIGIDAAATMIDSAKQNYPQVKFEIADAQNFSFDYKFDAVFSNAALHWMNKPTAVINCIWNSLKPSGRFIFEMGGKGNIATIEDAISYALEKLGLPTQREFNYFPTIGEYGSLLEQQGFQIKYAVLYERPTLLEGDHGLRNWIGMFRNNVIANLDASSQKKFFEYAENYARNKLYQNGQWHADYIRLRMQVIKPI